eukprot:GHVL01002391.1.p1 GENE.GHVL01002391.1~~GHVL01002391.1.p1  ORF type:complete len:113 (-),score=16.16 GHVL01002391.1:966-1304(-)
MLPQVDCTGDACELTFTSTQYPSVHTDDGILLSKTATCDSLTTGDDVFAGPVKVTDGPPPQFTFYLTSLTISQPTAAACWCHGCFATSSPGLYVHKVADVLLPEGLIQRTVH